eukprot:1291728-Pleurochrysis_carterae.AAC.1
MIQQTPQRRRPLAGRDRLRFMCNDEDNIWIGQMSPKSLSSSMAAAPALTRVGTVLVDLSWQSTDRGRGAIKARQADRKQFSCRWDL